MIASSVKDKGIVNLHQQEAWELLAHQMPVPIRGDDQAE
jgi:hypothetical protein